MKNKKIQHSERKGLAVRVLTVLLLLMAAGVGALRAQTAVENVTNVVNFHYTNNDISYSLSWTGNVNDGCRIVTTSDTDPFQQWILVDTGEADNQNFYLLNVGSGTYLTIGALNAWTMTFVNDPTNVDNRATFSLDGNNKIITKNGYLGLDNNDDRLFGNKREGGGTAWTLHYCASVPINFKNKTIGESLAWTDNAENPCRVITTNIGDDDQLWIMEDTGDGYFNLKNQGSVKYLSISTGNYWDLAFYDDPLTAPATKSKFTLVTQNNGDVYIKHEYVGDNGNVYIGVNSGGTTDRRAYASQTTTQNSTFAISVGRVATPVIAESNGSYTITCATAGATIYYTTDGSDPTNSATQQTYSSAITLPAGSSMIRAIAMKSGLVSSHIATAYNGNLYFAIHQAGTGNGRYLTVNNANAEINGNNDMPRWSDMYNNGNGIWVMTPEGYLKSEYYYLTVANNSLILTVEPKTQWELVDNAGTGRMDIRYNGMYLYYDGGTPPVQLAPNPANRYRACPITMNEKPDSWTEPATGNLTLQSPQLLTYLRYYYQRKITFSFTDDNGTDRTRPNAFGNYETDNYVDRREYALLEYVSGGDGKGTDWDVTTDNSIIYNKTDHDVTVKATFRLTPADPIAAAAHTTYVEKEITFTLQPRYLVPDAGKKYLLYDTNKPNNRFLQGTTETAENAQVTSATGGTAQLTYPANNNISWKIEDDGTGFYYLKNVAAGRYIYFDFNEHTGSDYGSIKYGATTVPSDDNRYKFRLYMENNEVDIIPYEYQHVVYRSNAAATGIYSSLNTYAGANVISLWRSNESRWRIYAYEFDAASALISGPVSATAAGAYNFTATLRIKNSTADDLVITPAYQWAVTGLDDYVTLANATARTSTVTVNSMPAAKTTGTVTVTFSEGITRALAFTLYPTLTFTDITSLAQITNAAGVYRLTQDASDDVPAGSKDFSGVLDGGGHTVSNRSASLFNTLSGTVYNLNLSGVGISGGENVGAVAQTANGGARIYNVGVLDGTVSGSGNVGSIVGMLDDYARVINCFSYATVSGGTVGGIVGNNNYASTNTDLRTMVMNCMFYGNATGTDVAPIYNGQIIDNNSASGLNNFNYYSFEDFTGTINTYNCALGAEKRFLQRFEFYRQILNSNRELAAWYVDGSHNENNIMYKWVLETADRQIASPKPYPVLREQGTYPSIINMDAAHAPDSTAVGRNHGGKLGKTLTVTISDVGSNAPTGASINTGSLSLTRTDKDFDRYNFNYDKVQLPYYNEVGTGNYTGNKVVTGWKITAITGGTAGTYTAADDNTGYNFADRNCTNKDLYSVTGRVFSQGAYFDVPYGVTAITIEPYWATAAYLSDPYYDEVYDADYTNNATNNNDPYHVAAMGARYVNGTAYSINGDDQVVYTTMENAITALGLVEGNGIYDKAVVLVGNYHRYYRDTKLQNDTKGFTIMSADLDKDNEPDNCLIYQHTDRHEISPIHFDFLCWPGIGMAQKPSDSERTPGIGILCPRGWFEVTNTCLARFTEFEYDRYVKNADSPVILLGGVFEQFVSAWGVATHTNYVHVGGNAWFKEFNNGCHSNNYNETKHVPISVTGGDYDKFYLSGVYQSHTDDYTTDNSAECYISGGRFGEVAGAGMEQIKGDVYWQIYNADISNFYGGGINAAQPITGNVTTNIYNSNVDVFCGGPKFGNMAAAKTVTSTANGTTFGTFFGAGYGGTSYNRVRRYENVYSFNFNWNDWRNTNYNRRYDQTYGGIATSYEYEFFAYAGFSNTNYNVGRFYVNFASLSLAQTNNVTSTLTGCKITNNFYGGGNLGHVEGDITSTLTDCTVDGSVYGAGFSATAPTVDVMPAQNFTTQPFYDEASGTYRQGVFPASVTYTWKQAASVSAGNEFDETDGHYILTTVDMTNLGTVSGNVTLNVNGTTTVANDVYGGGALASSNTTAAANLTTVNLTGGTVSGNVYGGAQGDEGTSATVGSVIVNLNNGVADTGVKGCVVSGNIFGCNNVNGSPKGTVEVHVYATQNASATQIVNSESVTNAKVKGTYDVKGVYGGGNLAEYAPDDPTNAKTEVIIDGCDRTSIQQVYGGGNAASVPATEVTVNGTYEIDEVFGGGNGKDALPNGDPNPGAHVGYHAYGVLDYDERNSARYIYGTGQAQVNINGGTIHSVYGGSNTRGNVRQIAVAMLEEKVEDGTPICDFVVDEAYGGGKSATMDGQARLEMKCIPGLTYAYGGSRNADINAGVTLNITNGNFSRVFGGNNEGGRINGSITVNIEETGCRSINIGELYGGGNLAPYSIYGYKEVTENVTETDPDTGMETTTEVTKLLPRESAEDAGTGPASPYADPQVNLKSFTSIGTVYGGGYGETATVVGSPTVSINEVVGDNATTAVGENIKIVGTKLSTSGDEGYTTGFEIPSHESGKIGAVNTVFGGGNAARVIGNTTVNVGTVSTIDYVTQSATDDSVRTNLPVKGADIRDNVYGGGNRAEVTGNTEVNVGVSN